jgi:hypothetical protein
VSELEAVTPNIIVIKNNKIEGVADKRCYDLSVNELNNKFIEFPIGLDVSRGFACCDSSIVCITRNKMRVSIPADCFALKLPNFLI